MRLHPCQQARAAGARRGSALLLSFLVLIVLAAIVFQLFIGTSTDARVARNEILLVTMDQAIESALLEVQDRLRTDAESAGGAGTDTGAAAGAAAGLGTEEGAAPSGAAPPGGEAQPVDSREDSWGKPQRTTINEIELRVLVQDEDSKINLLGMLAEDEREADKCFERVLRVIDMFREGTAADVDRSDARRLADALREFLRNRSGADLPRPELLSDDEAHRERGLPLSLRELVVQEPFEPGLFRDFRDDRGQIVHSLGAFLTVWTSVTAKKDADAAKSGSGSSAGAAPGGPSTGGGEPASSSGAGSSASGAQGQGAQAGTGQGAPGAEGQGASGSGGGSKGAGGGSAGAGGVAVNVNTAPAAVLKSLVDERDVPYRFWDEVIEYRNLEEKKKDGEEEPDAEPVFDEFGNEVIQRQVFDSLQELGEVPGWDRLDGEQRAALGQLLSTQSQVFSIYVTARRATGQQDSFGGVLGSERRGAKEDQLGNALVRTVRAVVWRYQDGDEIRIVPIVRWEVLDYTPFEVLDYPEADR